MAARKCELLGELATAPSIAPPDLLLLRDALSFLRAFPDSAETQRLADRLTQHLGELVRHAYERHASAWRLDNSGLPGAVHVFPYSYDVARRLVRIAPTDVDLEPDTLADADALHEALAALVSTAENPALDDVEIGTRDWIARCVAGGATSGLEAVLEVFESAPVPPALRAALYESAEVTSNYELAAPASSRLGPRLDLGRTQFRRKPFARESFGLPARIRRELPAALELDPTVAREWLDQLLLHLLSRDIEIYPLTHAEERDVRVFTLGRGYHLLLAGVEPSRRCAFELSSFYVVLSNGVPIAYGPASPFLGCCEMGINFFEEFRGGEARYIYAGVMSVLHHAFGVERFFVSAYGMGKRNEAALATGAFWFYRKIGFSVENDEVETLARAEEARRLADPSYRCDRATMRRLSNTSAFLDLSAGRCRRFDSSALALAVTCARRGRRAGAGKRELEGLRNVLGLGSLASWTDAERASLEAMAPVLGLLERLPAWNQRDKRTLVRIIRSKAAHSERDVDRAMRAHPRLEAELRELAGA